MHKIVSVFYCFPRSGGTLLNQCLLCTSDNVVLSEVNPADCVMAVEQQATKWFNLLSQAESIRICHHSYLEKIELIRQRTCQAGKRLCLRDWTGINFLEKISPWHGNPSMQLEQRAYLGLAGYKLNEIALLRRSQAVYYSILENIPELKDLSAGAFCSTYRAYVEQIAPAKKYRLEELVSDKQGVLRNICADLNLQYPADFETRFHAVKTVTGNNTLPKPPASAGWTSIRSSEAGSKAARAPVSDQTKLFEELDELVGYEPSSR